MPSKDIVNDGPRNNCLLARLVRAKPAFTTRHVQLDDAAQLTRSDVSPKAGDLSLAHHVDWPA